MSKGLVRGLIGAFVAALATALILEGAIRVFHLIPDDVPIPYRPMPGDEHYAPVPGESARSLYGITYRTDSLGLRGPERSLARIPQRVRVALVGDSVVWGFGVAEGDTISAALERVAQSHQRDLEVWNLGVPANNTFHEKARFARLGPLLHPDVTVVVVLYNDLQPGPGRDRVTSARTLSNAARRAPYPDAWRPTLEKSALFQALIRLYTALERREEDAYDMRNLPALLEQLDQIRLTAERIGSRLIVAAMPSAWPDADHFSRLADGLRQFCEPRRIRFVDLSATLGRPARRDYLLPADSVHPTVEAARLIAQALWPPVEEALNRP